ncbi:MAG: ABC transporter permease [Planctomycetales bacterium]|nr:ABC transporter permease [Planctomycetales bacterium]
MNKVLTVAKAEYLVAVTSKAFLVGVIMMPVFMGGAILVQYLTKDQVDLSPRKIAVIDYTGKLQESIQTAAENYNQHGIYEGEGEGRKQVRAEFHVVIDPHLAQQEPIEVVLSERVKAHDLFAYAIIEDGVFDPKSNGKIRYHTETPSYDALPNWLSNTVTELVLSSRTKESGLTGEQVRNLIRPVTFKRFGLVETGTGGVIKDAEEENKALVFGVPFAGMMLMFMMIMSVAPSMLNNVLEEKMQKISEFLVSSISPTQLMLGKLLGALWVGLTLSAIYLGAAYGLANYFEVTDKIPVTIYLWFVFYLVIALIIFGSIFSAIGAACSEIRDAQSLMTPIMLIVIIPMMCMGPILNSPTSTFAKAVSLFPPATPMIMFLRIAIPPGPAVWEIVLGTVLTILFALGCVWAAGKVFRIGILSQGQAPSIARLMSWVLTKN